MLLENGTQVEGILEFLQEVVDDDGDCSARAAALITEVKEFSEAAAAFMPPKEPDQPVPGLQENGTYRYYSTQRPVDIGTFPKPPDNPVVEVHNYDADSRIPVENGMIQAWGYVEYQKPLTEKEAGVKNRSAYIRKMSLDGYIVKLDTSDINQMIALLRNATNNLNQVAKKANSTGSICGADIADMQAKQDEIWETAKEILARLATIQ